MRKLTFLTICVLIFGQMNYAQPTLIQGSEKPFTFKKQPRVIAGQNKGGAYFIFKPNDYVSYPELVSVSNSGNVEFAGEIKYDKGTMGNMNDILTVVSVGDKFGAMVENRDKSTGINKLTFRALDARGNLSASETEIGSFPFEKMTRSGDWFISVTPDGKHLAAVAEMPTEKDELVQFKYFFVDADLKSISNGQFTFPDTKKRILFNSFHASDKGDLYLVKQETEKTYHYPAVYRAKTGATSGTIVPVMIDDEKTKMANYTVAVHPNGDLIIGGYSKAKSWMTVGQEQMNGSFLYSSANGKVNVNAFAKPVDNAIAQKLLVNGNTIFLVGEQIGATREKQTPQQMASFEENFTYKHNDVLITAFDTDTKKLFDLNMLKDFSARNFDQDLYPAVGIVNDKLAVVYNDQYGKYVPNTSYDRYKVPVIVYVTNDGLMEAPVLFDKEFQIKNSTYTLYPKFASAGASGLIMLAGNGTNIRGVVVR